MGLFICSGFLMSSNKMQSTAKLTAIIIKADDHQLDILMTVWYDSFYSYQEEGKSTKIADQLACIDAMNALKNLY